VLYHWDSKEEAEEEKAVVVEEEAMVVVVVEVDFKETAGSNRINKTKEMSVGIMVERTTMSKMVVVEMDTSAMKAMPATAVTR